MLIIAAIVFSCTEDEYISNQRQILAVKVDGQIGMADVPTSMEVNDTVKILVTESVDISNLAPNIVISPGAKINPASGQAVDFASNGNKYNYTITAESGVTKEWVMVVETFDNPLKGTWTIETFEIYWDDWFGWGNAGTLPFVDIFPETAPGLDDIIVMGPIEDLTDDGAVWGNYERQAGPDGEFASWVYTSTGTNWGFKFDKVPAGTGKWFINVDGSITIVSDSGITSNMKKIETTSDGKLKLFTNPGDQGWDIDWGDYYGNNYNKFIAAWDVWYTLKKQ